VTTCHAPATRDIFFKEPAMMHLGRPLVFAFCLLGLAMSAASAGDAKPEPGFVSLFNGKDLTGWKYYKETNLDGKTETADKRFTVTGGVIVANEGKGIKDLYTVSDYNKDFILRMQFRASLKSDSGVYVRGPQLQVRDYIRRGERKQLKKFKNDDWNDLEIVVKGGIVKTVVNGKSMTDKDTLQVTVKDGKPSAVLNGTMVDVNKIEVSIGAVAKCYCNGEFLEDMPIPMKSASGIGLQAETGKFEFRNIRIKMVDAASTSAAAPTAEVAVLVQDKKPADKKKIDKKKKKPVDDDKEKPAPAVELPGVKVQRDLADTFMRKVAETALENLKKGKKKDNEKAIANLEARLKAPRYFQGGTGEKELAAHSALLAEADKAKVKVGGDGLRELIKADVGYGVDDKTLKALEKSVADSSGTKAEVLMGSVANEFRARIVRDLSTKKN
jgi:hypothetical protein